MWAAWNAHGTSAGQVTDKGSFPLTSLLNILAGGSVLLMDASFEAEHAVKDAIDARERNETLRGAIAATIKRQYFVSAVVVFGKPEATLAVSKWLAENTWKCSLAVYRFECTGEELLRTFSFLSAHSSWAMRQDTSHYQLPHQINEYLFLGDYACATNPLLIEHLGVTCIVNASGGFANVFEDKARYLDVNIWDSPSANVKEHFAAAIAFIDEARARNEKVLSHCAAGISRSTTIVLAYLMAREGMTLRASYLHVKGIRSIVQPNCGFVRQLIEFEEELFGKNSVMLPDDVNLSYFGLSDLIRLEWQRSGEKMDDEMKKLLADD